jgi:hypothetical protein
VAGAGAAGVDLQIHDGRGTGTTGPPDSLPEEHQYFLQFTGRWIDPSFQLGLELFFSSWFRGQQCRSRAGQMPQNGWEEMALFQGRRSRPKVL